MKGPHYTSEDLLRLRDSPLVRKPKDLPPPEEWIGSPQPDRSQKPVISRAKTDGVPFQDRTNTRPSLFETRHITRTSTLPDDIVLGPPKTAFASATSLRTLTRNTDSSEAPVSSSNDDINPKNEKPNYRDRPLKDKDKGGRERWRTDDPDEKAPKEDSEGWSLVRPRKSSIPADGEEAREHRWGGGRQHRFQHGNVESGQDRNRDRDKDGLQRRGGMARGRNDYSRSKGYDGHGKEETDRPPGRERRDRDQGGDWDRGRSNRGERQPEWMDSKGRDEKPQSHTADDFLKWKERMKAASEPSKAEDGNAANHDERVTEMPREEQKSNLPIIMETGVDQFFGLWGTQATDHSRDIEPSMVGPKTDVPPVKGSRFKSFFAPQEAVKQPTDLSTIEGTANNQTKDTTSEDKEGFQRILQMLGGASLGAGNTTSNMDRSEQTTQPAPDSRTETTKATEPPGLAREVREDNTLDRDQALRENFLGQQKPQLDHFRFPPPAQSAQQKNNNDFLLSLMNQTRTHHEPGHPIREFNQPITSMNDLPVNVSGEELWHYTQGIHPGFKDHMRDNHGMITKGNGGRPPGLPNDPSIIAAGPQQRRPTIEGLPLSSRTMVQKPPGLEHLGWPNNMQPQQQPQTQPPPPPQGRQIPLPPGLPTDPNANNRASTFAGVQPFINPPPGMPYPPNLLHRGSVPGMGQVMNPNMPPPPGFFNMNMPLPGGVAPGVPPPGYPPLPFVQHPHLQHQQDGMMPGSAGVGMPPPPPPGAMGPPPPLNMRPAPGMVPVGMPPPPLQPLPLPAPPAGARFPFGGPGPDLTASHNGAGGNGAAHPQPRRV
ncbi:MAG: hypothetical protein M1816_001685 [Peltula sp. TS41687]|nr:MAG: hypothetical protein M1816_001685 [Peltula sp. TS41687]